MTTNLVISSTWRMRLSLVGMTVLLSGAFHFITVAVQGKISKSSPASKNSDLDVALLQEKFSVLSKQAESLQAKLAATESTMAGLHNEAENFAIQESGLSRLKIREHVIFIGTSDQNNGLGGNQEIRYDGNGGKIPETFLTDKDGDPIEFGQRIVGAWYNVNGHPQNMRDMNYVGVRIVGNKAKWFCNNHKPVGPYLIKVFVLYVE